MILGFIGLLMFLLVGIWGIVGKELLGILFGFGFFFIPLPYLCKEVGFDFSDFFEIICYVLGGLLIISGIVCLIFGLGFENSSTNLIKNECLSNFNQYNLDFCIDNLNGIKVCERISATFIKSENHIFSSPNYICERGGEIIKI